MRYNHVVLLPPHLDIVVRELTYLVRGLCAKHSRHVDVHQYESVLVLASGDALLAFQYCFLAAYGPVRADLEFLFE